MKGILKTFEVKVRNNGQIEMFHYDARNHSHAAKMAKKHGQIVSVQKANYSKMKGNIEKLDLHQTDELYATAIGIDTIGMMNRNKRIDRRDNQYRDKPQL